MKQIRPHLQIAMIYLLPLGLVGCLNLERSPQSGYQTDASKTTRSGWEKTQTDNLTGPEHKAQYSDTRMRLKQLENQLSSRRELEQYSKILPYFKSDQERVDFLSSGTYEDRQMWLRSADLPGRIAKTNLDFKSVIDSQDIALGMPDDLVKKSWGDPKSMDVSGVPELRNQRWIYSKYVSTPYGYKTEQKAVYFEGGKVVGWETTQ